MMKMVTFIKTEWPTVARTAVGISGVAMFSFGAWLAWHPAGFMLPGVFLVWVAMASSTKAKS